MGDEGVLWEGERRTGDEGVWRESAGEESLVSNWVWRAAKKGGVDGGVDVS